MTSTPALSIRTLLLLTTSLSTSAAWAGETSPSDAPANTTVTAVPSAPVATNVTASAAGTTSADDAKAAQATANTSMTAPQATPRITQPLPTSNPPLLPEAAVQPTTPAGEAQSADQPESNSYPPPMYNLGTTPSTPTQPASSLSASGQPPVNDTGVAPASQANPTSGNSFGGFFDFNLYPYMSKVKSDSVFTLNAAAKLKYGFSYFSLTNIVNSANEEAFNDTEGYYTEQNLRWSPEQVKIPLDLTVQYNMRGGPDNDRLRFGVRWRLDSTPLIDSLFKAINFSYSVNFHLFEFDHEDKYVWQMEHVGRIDTPYLDRRLYVAGFADHTFNQSVPGVPKAPIIAEFQAGVRLIDEFYVVAEYRINEYRVGAATNVGAGVEYVAKW